LTSSLKRSCKGLKGEPVISLFSVFQSKEPIMATKASVKKTLPVNKQTVGLPFPPTREGLSMAHEVYLRHRLAFTRSNEAEHRLEAALDEQRVLCRAKLARVTHEVSNASRLLVDAVITSLPTSPFYGRVNHLAAREDQSVARSVPFQNLMAELEGLENLHLILDEAGETTQQARKACAKVAEDIHKVVPHMTTEDTNWVFPEGFNAYSLSTTA
jgi:hypothetical protein